MSTSARSTTDAEKTIGEMADRIAKRFRPEKIILFGSFARGTAGPDSDADFLVIMPVSGSRREAAIEIDVAISGMGLAKDVFVATPEDMRVYGRRPGTLASIALREGRTLYEHPA